MLKEAKGMDVPSVGEDVDSAPTTRLAHNAFLNHVDKLKELCRRRVAPASITRAVLREWFRRSFPRLDVSELSIPKAIQNNAVVTEFASALSEQSLIDAAYWLSSAHAKLLDGDKRKALAMYFTPPELAARVLDDLQEEGVRFGLDKFLDPACGGAAFLVPIAIRIRKELLVYKSAKEVLTHVETHLTGIDLDQTLCALSRQFLRAAFYDEIISSGYEPQFQIVCGDSLDEAVLYGPVDVVVCNPPYRKMAKAETEAAKTNFAEILSAQPNLYGVFISLCVRLLNHEGTCAVVTPTSYLSGHSFEKLRKYLVRQAHIVSIGILSAREGVFIDVLQEAAVTTISRPKTGMPCPTRIFLLSPQGERARIGDCILPDSGAPWPIPRDPLDVRLLANAAALRSRLSDYGYQARVGGYVWNRDRRKAYVSAKFAERYSKNDVYPLLWSSDIKAGGAVSFDGARKPNGERRFVQVDEHLRSAVIKGPCVLLQRVTSNDQKKRLIAATVPKPFFSVFGGFVGENHTVIVAPTTDQPALTPSQMTELLTCQYVDRLFRCISGAANVSVFELNQLPLPDPLLLRSMLNRGLSMEMAVHALIGG